MKKVLLVALTLIGTLNLFAQIPGGGAPNAAAMNIGHVYGKLVDSLQKPIADASVSLLQTRFDTTTKKPRSILLKSAITTNKGEFSFEELPIFGPLTLKISAVGFKPIEQNVSFMSAPPAGGSAPAGKPAGMPDMSAMLKGTDKDLGSIKLSTDVSELQNVTVSASSTGLKMDIDKKTFNVDQNIVSSGGTAADVMKNVPSVQVDIDGNVKLRNATPQIYVDGRPTTLSLDQIPADAIQSVEVITNPSAKYDASGGNAGILNIVLKKNKRSGYNGNLTAGVDSRGGVNGGGSFSLRQGKFNVTATSFANAMRNKATGYTDRYTYGNNPTHVAQENTDKTNGAFIFGKLGLDYYITNRSTISLAGIKVHGEFKPNSIIRTDSLDNNNEIFKYNERTTRGTREFNANGLQASFVHNFAKEGEQLSFDGNLFSGKNNGNSLYSTSSYLGDKTYTGQNYQQQLSNGSNSFYTIQGDYVNPLTKNVKLETGLRAQIRKTTNNNYNYIGSDPNNLALVPALTNNYKNTDNVYAAYATVTSSIKNFGYQIGLRGESSNYKGELTNTGQKFSNNYPISLFPSVFLSQKLENKQTLQLNYSRRVNRPNFFQFIPYYDFTDSLNITKGNPNLVPEFTNSFEASYSKTFKNNNNLLFSIYYKQTSNLITRYINTETINDKELLVNSYINALSSNSYGAELTSTNKLKKWWDITTNVNVYNGKINTSNVPNATGQDALWSWFGKLNNTFKLPKSFTFELSGNYQSKTNLPVNQNQGFMGPPGAQAQSSSQGYIKSFWNVDAAIKKTFLKSQAASVTLSVSDIFRTRINQQISSSDGIFYQDYYRLNNPQLFRLNFSYRFGKIDMGIFKRQNMKSTSTQDAMQIGG